GTPKGRAAFLIGNTGGLHGKEIIARPKAGSRARCGWPELRGEVHSKEGWPLGRSCEEGRQEGGQQPDESEEGLEAGAVVTKRIPTRHNGRKRPRQNCSLCKSVALVYFLLDRDGASFRLFFPEAGECRHHGRVGLNRQPPTETG